MSTDLQNTNFCNANLILADLSGANQVERHQLEKGRKICI
ncbi:pentapeptide repeat-containing protein [Trichodesmium erythraeum]